MSRFLKFLLVGLVLWLLTGIYIVGGNERAVVRRFGKAVKNEAGEILLKHNGLHFDWPWPMSRVDRVNVNEVRTLSVPVPSNGDGLLLGDEAAPEPLYLTGDKNLLTVYLTVHFRLADSQVTDFLYGSVSIEDRLACLAESATAELLARSGVDFVQLAGFSELRQQLKQRLQQHAEESRLGVLIEDVTLDEISPPVQVKADFLDVANARADREQFLQSALSSADQRRQSAEAEAREIQDAAQSDAQKILQAAEGSAARFLQIIAQFQEPDSAVSPNSALARRLALEQYYHRTIAEILERIQGKVFLETGQPVDLTFWRSLKSEKSETEKSPTNRE